MLIELINSLLVLYQNINWAQKIIIFEIIEKARL